ncbi:MAG: histidine phosphatase family protein [Pseudomonadota bacterium]
MSTVTLMHHGATTHPGHFHGQDEVALSPKGTAEMYHTLAGARFDHIISSPLKRCADFARDFAACLDVPCELDEGWTEISFGEWEGKSTHEIMSSAPNPLKAFWRDPLRHTPPGGESLHEAARRVERAWKRLPEAEDILIITHAGIMRLLFCRVMGLPLSDVWRIELHHLARLTFTQDERGVRLRFFDAGRP